MTWWVGVGLAVLGFSGAVFVLNSTLYSAAGFVHGYLDSLARHDIAGAMALPGVDRPPGTADDLLVPSALGELSDVRLVSDHTGSEGLHTVEYSYSLGPQLGRSQFTVEPAGTMFGLFSAWRFAESPLGSVSLSVEHDHRFTVNQMQLQSAAGADAAAVYAVFVPGYYGFDHESTYLEAQRTPAVVTSTAERVEVTVAVQANDVFVAQVQAEVNAYLDDECVPQEVLMPTGCPFGQSLTNRGVSAPQWSITDYPDVTIIPGDEPGTWLVPETGATAHLVIDVQSLFDGTISTFDEDVPFTIEYSITFLPRDELYIQAI